MYWHYLVFPKTLLIHQKRNHFYTSTCHFHMNMVLCGKQHVVYKKHEFCLWFANPNVNSFGKPRSPLNYSLFFGGGGVIPALLEVLSGFRYIQRKTQRWIAGVAKPSQPLQFKIWYKIWCFDCFATPTCDPQHSKRALGNIFKDCKSTKRFDIHYTSNEKTTKWGLYDTEGSRLWRAIAQATDNQIKLKILG